MQSIRTGRARHSREEPVARICQDERAPWRMRKDVAFGPQRCPLLHQLCRSAKLVQMPSQPQHTSAGHYIVPSTDETLKPFFPPKLEILLAWANTFRSIGTFQNYIGYVKTATMVLKASVEVGMNTSAILLPARLTISFHRCSRTLPYEERRGQYRHQGISKRDQSCSSRGE